MAGYIEENVVWKEYSRVEEQLTVVERSTGKHVVIHINLLDIRVQQDSMALKTGLPMYK